MGCAGGFGCGAGVEAASAVHHISHDPKTKSLELNSSRANGGETLGEILRSGPTRNLGNEMRVVNMHRRQRAVPNGNVGNTTRLVLHRQRQTRVGYRYNRIKMTHCTEVGKMERIDEDKPFSFEEDQNDFKGHLLYLYPRSRRHVVNSRAVYYQ